MVDHVGTGMYRREVLLRVGGFDPSLPVNEDFELDHRIRRAGGLIRLEPRATFTSFSRGTPQALVRQMWRYGFYKARTLVLHPDSLKARQLAPPALVALVVTTLIVRPTAALGLIAAYAGLAGAAGAVVAGRSGESRARGAVVLPLVHLTWGAGLWAGLVRHLGPRRRTPVSAPRPSPVGAQTSEAPIPG